MREAHDPTEPGELIRYGTVATVDRAARRITVKAGDLESAPIRWLANRAGATRSYSPPSVGEQVVLLCPDGELGAGIALLGVESDAHQLPGDGEAELVEYSDGAQIGYDPETHALTATLPDGATVHLVAKGGITIDGDITLKGKLTVSETIEAKGDVKAGSVSLQSHIHDKTQPGTGVSGKPLP